MSDTKKQRLLWDARDVVGLKALQRGLKVDAEQLRMWMDGDAAMPDRKLRDLSALLLEFAKRKS